MNNSTKCIRYYVPQLVLLQMIPIDASYIWESYNLDEVNNQLIFEKETLTFSLFHVNSDDIKEIHDQLKGFLDPFMNHYPWFHSPPSFEIFTHGSEYYIYGELVYQDNLNDEWLFTSLLWEFSKYYPDLYIHLWDSSDLEFLLVECSDLIPDWLEPNNSLNRVWINYQTALIINPIGEPKNLTLDQALEQLFVGNFKKYSEISGYLREKLSSINKTFFVDLIYDLDICLPKQAIQIFANEPWLISQSINEFIKESLSINKTLRFVQNIEVHNCLTGIPFLSLNLMKFKQLELKNTGSVEIEFSELVSKILTVGLDNMMKQNRVSASQVNGPMNLSRDVIQDALILAGRLSKKEPENLTLNKSFENMNEDDSSSDLNESILLNKFNEFFKDTTAGLEGVENKSDDDESVDSKQINDDQPNQDVDIDEDDFFEFFLKEALKLSDNDLESYRNTDTNETPRKRKMNESKVYNDESDYQTDKSSECDEENSTEEDEVESEYMKQILQKLNGNNDIDSLSNLFKSINTDIGPGSILLQQGVNQQNRKKQSDS